MMLFLHLLPVTDSVGAEKRKQLIIMPSAVGPTTALAGRLNFDVPAIGENRPHLGELHQRQVTEQTWRNAIVPVRAAGIMSPILCLN